MYLGALAQMFSFKLQFNTWCELLFGEIEKVVDDGQVLESKGHANQMTLNFVVE